MEYKKEVKEYITVKKVCDRCNNNITNSSDIKNCTCDSDICDCERYHFGFYSFNKSTNFVIDCCKQCFDQVLLPQLRIIGFKVQQYENGEDKKFIEVK